MDFFDTSDGQKAYITTDGDTVDLIAFRYYGTHEGTTEALYEANPGLAALPTPLAAGVFIFLPAFTPDLSQTAQIQLWD